MLSGLHISDYTIITELSLDYAGGMTVITGETGAGKSITLDALALALGARGDQSVVRPGRDQCQITAVFSIDNVPAVQHWLQQQALEADGECILRRVISKEGRSKGFINQQPVTMLQLRQLGQHLVQIHGQHAQQLLLECEHQRDILDFMIKHPGTKTQIAATANAWQQARQKLHELQKANPSQDQLALLRYQLQELEELNIHADEFTLLETQFKTLSKADQLIQQSLHAANLLENDDGNDILTSLNQAMRCLQSIQPRSEALNSINDCLQQAIINAEEANHELLDYRQSVEMDADKLASIETRLEKIYSIARKHQVQPENLYQHQQDLSEQLFNLENSENVLKQLQQQCDELRQQYQTQADKLTKQRKQASKPLATQIQTHIRQLGMPKGEVDIQVMAQPDIDPSVNGQDHIQFLVKTNPGQTLQPLAKVVSGGELSRISLAIQVIAAEHQQIPTLLFDEVDVGIGGSTAAIVGRLLQQLSQQTQVICVTHQPQVAACGNQHLRVEKHSDDASTDTKVKLLNRDEKIQEIARMIGGIKINEQTTAHAKALIAEAVEA